MPAPKLVLLVQVGVVRGIKGADKIGFGASIAHTATDNLFYLALVKINTGAKRSQKANSK
jgi:hypothetical protein